ncbi:MAG: chorismate--pyruvate lyase family protein [Thiobacillus sp.]
MPLAKSSWLAHPHTHPLSLRAWLSDKGSLTQRLKSRCETFRVVPLTTGLARPNPDEYALLGVAAGTRVYIREVLLVCNDLPVVFAHSVLPYPSLRGGWNSVSRLGNRPLGEALFSNHRIHRQPLAFRHLHREHPLFRTIARHLDLTVNNLWGRRSVFCLNQHPLLVTEVFLPAIDSL